MNRSATFDTYARADIVPERGEGTRTRFKGRISFNDGLYLRNVDLRYAGAAS